MQFKVRSLFGLWAWILTGCTPQASPSGRGASHNTWQMDTRRWRKVKGFFDGTLNARELWSKISVEL